MRDENNEAKLMRAKHVSLTTIIKLTGEAAALVDPTGRHETLLARFETVRKDSLLQAGVGGLVEEEDRNKELLVMLANLRNRAISEWAEEAACASELRLKQAPEKLQLLSITEVNYAPISVGFAYDLGSVSTTEEFQRLVNPLFEGLPRGLGIDVVGRTCHAHLFGALCGSDGTVEAGESDWLQAMYIARDPLHGGVDHFQQLAQPVFGGCDVDWLMDELKTFGIKVSGPWYYDVYLKARAERRHRKISSGDTGTATGSCKVLTSAAPETGLQKQLEKLALDGGPGTDRLALGRPKAQTQAHAVPKKICNFYCQAGGCRKGTSCSFLHMKLALSGPKPQTQGYAAPPKSCNFYRQAGGCRKGASCPFLHV